MISVWGIITSIGVVLVGLALGSVMWYRNDFEFILLLSGVVMIIAAIPASYIFDNRNKGKSLNQSTS